MTTPDLVPTDDLTALLRARDALLEAWRVGALSGEVCQSRLAALSAPDAYGHQWRLRPGAAGAVFVRLGPTGEVEIADPAAYRAPVAQTPQGVTWLVRAATGAWATLWLVAMLGYLRAGG